MKWRGRERLLHLNGFKILRSEKEHCSAVTGGEIPKAETFSCLQDASLEAFSKLTSKMIGPNFIPPVPHLWFLSSVSLLTPDYWQAFSKRSQTCQNTTQTSFCRDLDLNQGISYGWHTLAHIKYSRKRLFELHEHEFVILSTRLLSGRFTVNCTVVMKI